MMSAPEPARWSGTAYQIMQKTMCALMMIGASSWAQQPKVRPDFKAFAVENVFTGAPAVPKLSRSQQTFRTMIRQGAKSKVEFAGHYTVPRWGCGSGCSTFVIVDSITGAMYNGFNLADLPVAWIEKHGEQEQMGFRPESRLLKINGCVNEENCGFYDYTMIEGKGLKLLRKELLPQEFQ
jgi:hypothetical protein